MKRNILSAALSEISDRHIAEAAQPKKSQQRIYWLGAAAAVLAFAVFLGSIGLPGAPAPTVLAIKASAVALAQYPEMAPYPDEQAHISKSGEVLDSFYKEYDNWHESRTAVWAGIRSDEFRDAAGGADLFAAQSAPIFLTGAKGNRAYSPMNIYMALAMSAELVDGAARDELLTALGADSMDALRQQAEMLWRANYCADGASASLLANSLWLDTDVAYDQDTMDRIAKNFYASVYRGDLGSEEVNESLRVWLNEQTGGLLEKQASNLSLDPETVLALASTVYFREKWSLEFWKENNLTGEFHAPGGDISAEFMRQTLDHGPYFWGDDFGAVRLSLENGSSMWLILPDEDKNADALLASGDALALAMQGGSAWEQQKFLKVHLSLPKFDISSDLNLNDGLQEMGIRTIFSADADFSPSLPGMEGVYLGKTSHAVRVAIDEEGVTAAAYTVMQACGTAAPPEEEMDFVLDRPFLFVITSRDNLPLFMGVVNDVSQN